MALKTLLSLLGVEEVEAGFARASKAGEDFLKSWRDASSNIEQPLESFNNTVTESSDTLGRHSAAVVGFRDALHLLHPVLNAAGIQMSEFTAFSRAAGGGIALLGAAIGGAIVVALANLEDKTKATKGVLEDLFQSKNLGDQAFTALADSATKFGTTVGNLAPGFEALTTAFQKFVQTTQQFKFVAPPGLDLPASLTGNVKNLSEAYANFINILRAGRQTQADAEKTASAFFTALQNGGKLTADVLKTLPVGSIELIAQAMGRGTISTQQFIAEVGLAPIPLNKLLDALDRFGPQSEQAFQTRAIKTYKDVLGELLNTLTSGFKDLSGTTFSDFLVQNLERVKQGIKDTIDEFNKLKALVQTVEQATEMPGMGKLVQDLKQLFVTAPTAGGVGGAAVLPPNTKQVTDQLSANFKTVPKAAEEAVSESTTAIDDSLTQMQDTGNQTVERIKAAFQAAPQAFAGIWSTAESDFQSFGNRLASDAQQIWDRINAILTQPIVPSWGSSDNTFLSQQPLNLASGGFVRGPGTTTSDSIWARLSDKEFVLNAKATQFYGAELLYALNTLRVPRQFPGFSMGGLVNAMANAMPRFASGGMATAGTPVTFVIDTHRFNVTAPADTVKALSRFSVHRQLSATGRKPSWVK